MLKNIGPGPARPEEGRQEGRGLLPLVQLAMALLLLGQIQLAGLEGWTGCGCSC